MFRYFKKQIAVGGLLSLFAFTALPSFSLESFSKPLDFTVKPYIVVLKDGLPDASAVIDAMSKNQGFSVGQVYSSALSGFSVKLPTFVAERLARDSRVEFVSEDPEVQALAVKSLPIISQAVPTGIQRIGAPVSGANGVGVGVAVIDTGINLSHPDLKANIASQGKNCVYPWRNADDDNGHGSHVAGIIAAVNNTSGVVGVAPGAKLFAVKVLDRNGSGSWSSVICGIDWVTANAQALGIKVANLSLGGGGSSDNNCGISNNDALHKALCRARDKGVTFVVAAGNSAANSVSAVPAAYNDAVITVSALADSDGAPGGGGLPTSYGPDDTFATFSNYGTSVDIGAPGVSIYSTYKNGGYATLSGTSMAAPHVAGAAAVYISTHPGLTWIQVKDALTTTGESLGSGHTDPSGKHPEPVLRINSF